MSRLDGVPAPTGRRKHSKAELEQAATFLDMLASHGVDVDDLFREGYTPHRITMGSHETGMKVQQEDGSHRVEVVEQKRGGFELRLSPSWAAGPQWPLPQPGPEFKVAAAKLGKRATDSKFRTLVCLPDIQAPFHDERALDVALQIVTAVGPDVVVMHGDNLDLPELSRFRKHPSFASSTQRAIDRMTLFCAELRAAAPAAEIVWIQGNHEARIEHYILDNAAAAYGISRGQLPDEDPQRPVLAVPELCRLDESGVTYLGGYPANDYWFQPNVRVVHGTYTGKSAPDRYLAEGTSVIWGHTHSQHFSHRTLADGRRIYALSPGCLCSVDGEVPGVMTGYDFGGPIRRPVNWDQGVLVGRGDGEQFWPELVPIVDGHAVFRGEHLTA